jgi:hypothetical protein
VTLSLPKRFATKFRFPEEAIVFESIAINADGSPSPVFVYRLKGRIEGLPEADMFIGVSQEDADFEDQDCIMSLDEPLMGRAIFDKYEVLFSGKSSPKRLSIS